jgi:CBS domain-containing protein
MEGGRRETMAEVKIPTAREWMTSKYMALTPETDLLVALGRMADKSVSAALVVEAGGKLVGVLTEKDCLRVLTLATYHEALAGKVGEFMSPLPECVDPDMDLLRISKLFLETNFPVLPVMEGEKLLGQISRQQVLQATKSMARKIEKELAKKAAIEEEADEITQRPRSIQEMQDVYSKSSPDQLIRRIKRKG